MQALPTARPADPTKERNFWDALGAEELTNWSKALASLAEKMFEATLRSGTYPLHAVHDEVFEFNVVIPLIQRYLFYRRIECEAQPFREKLACTQNPEKQKLLKEAHEKAIKARKKAIETIVKEDLAVKWKKEDKEEAEASSTFPRNSKGRNGLQPFEKRFNIRSTPATGEALQSFGEFLSCNLPKHQPSADGAHSMEEKSKMKIWLSASLHCLFLPQQIN